jgi:hypothetical protein
LGHATIPDRGRAWTAGPPPTVLYLKVKVKCRRCEW